VSFVSGLRELLRDRKRAQRGSVLSGVLIIVAFISILAGALMTELSTNLLLSRALVNRVGNEATVNSAVELAFNSLQSTPVAGGCPGLASINLNGRTAAVTYRSCLPVVDSGSTPLQRLATSAPVNVDGSHWILPAQGRNDYVVGDSAGNVFDYTFDTMTRRWKLALGGAVTGPPLEMSDPSNQPDGVIDMIPISNPQPGPNPACGQSRYCVASIKDDSDGSPTVQCFMPAGAAVTAQPAAGIANNDLTYFGDANGTLFVYDADEGNCAPLAIATVGRGSAVVAGPVVFAGSNGTDNLYLVASNGTSSQLLHYTFKSQNQDQDLQLINDTVSLQGRAVGMALEPGTLPSRLAIAFAGGQVSLTQIAANFTTSLLGSTNLQVSIAGAPHWCQCPGGNLIGVGGGNGALYLLDMALNRSATYPAGGPAINTTPTADSAGDWFFGARDGAVYEVQRTAGQTTMTLGTSFGSAAGQISSSPVLGTCQTSWICIYVGSTDSHLYVVPLDARRAVFSACISTSPPSCSGTNPRLYASVEVGSWTSANTVRVGVWSYYSP
jgi:hypothetical protein